MTDHQRRLWQTKLIFLLHDPADKALGIAGHEKRALSSIQAMLGKVDPKLLSWTHIADTLPDADAAANDRPCFT